MDKAAAQAAAQPAPPAPVGWGAGIGKGFAAELRRPPRLVLGAVAFLVVGQVVRGALLLVHGRDFAHLDGHATAAALAYGMRFDLALYSLAFAPVLWLLSLPVPWAQRRWWRWPLASFGALALVAVLLVEIGTVIYFGHVHRRPAGEVFAVGQSGRDLGFVTGMAFGPYLGATLASFACIAVLVWGWLRLALRPPSTRLRPLFQLPILAIVVPCLMVIGIRGGLQRKPIAPSSAFRGQGLAGGILSGSSSYQLLRLWWRHGRGRLPRYMQAGEAAAAVAELSGAEPVDPAYPMYRRSGRSTPALPGVRRVLIVIMEGWDGDAVDAVRQARGKRPLGLTPRFDALAERGRLLTNHYATGQRSNQGIIAILGGVPTVPDLPMIGFGLGLNRLVTLGTIAEDRGASTFFIRGARRQSFRLDAVMPHLGFRRYEGAEDIHPSGITAPHGVWDEQLFARVYETVTAETGPSVGVCFTLNTHPPWEVPGPRWRVRRGDSDYDRYLNSLHYSDHALGEFMERFLAHPAADETLVVIVSDHGVGQVPRPADDIPGRFRVPALLIGPGVEPRTDDRVTSQVDLLPTVLDALGWRAGHQALGRSLFDEAPGRRAFSCLEPALVVFDEDGHSAFAGGQLVGGDHDAETARRHRKSALALQQVVHRLNAENRFAPDDGP